MNRTISLRVLVGLSMVLGACGDDGGDGGNGGGAGGGGVADSTQVGDLTAGQVAMVCDDLNNKYSGQFAMNENAKQGSCLWVTAFALVAEPPDEDADPIEACDGVVNVCVANLTEENLGMAITEFIGEICTGAPPANCPVTVGEMDGCIADGIATLASVGSSQTCASLAADGTLAGTNTQTLVLPASCTAILDANCE